MPSIIKPKKKIKKLSLIKLFIKDLLNTEISSESTDGLLNALGRTDVYIFCRVFLVLVTGTILNEC